MDKGKTPQPASSTDFTSPFLDFGRRINAASTRTEVAKCLLDFLKKIGCGDSIWLFLRNSRKNEISVHSTYKLCKIEAIPSLQDDILTEFANKKEWTLELRSLSKLVRSQNLFPSKFKYVLLAPLLSGSNNVGVLKIDWKHQVAPKGARKEFIELGCRYVAHRWTEIDGAELLQQERRSNWFDNALLGLKSCSTVAELHKTIDHKLKKLKQIDPKLGISWKYFSRNQSGEIFISDLMEHGEGGQGRFERYQHYGTSSHIANFIDSNSDMEFYDVADLERLKLENFSGSQQAVICFKTGLQRHQIRGLGGEQDYVIIEVAGQEGFLQENQQLFQRVAKQFINTVNAIRMEVSDSTFDERYLHRTREIIAQLTNQHDKKKLIQFLLNKALSLAPDAEAVSYGEVTVGAAGASPSIEIIKSIGGDGGSHLLMNEGVWQSCWESKESVVVNNQFDAGGLKIKGAPIEKPQSALCVPLFNKHHKLTGIISLSSSQVSTFQPVHRRMIEWLAHGFSAQIRVIEAQERKGGNSASQPQEAVAPCISQIIQLFSEAEWDTTDYDQLFQQAIAEVVKGIGRSASWVLLEKHPGSHFEVVQQEKFNPLKNEVTGNLAGCPIVNELLSGKVKNFMEPDVRSNKRFTKLMPLLGVATRSCLAMSLSVERGKQEGKGSARDTTTYGLFLFHTIVDHYRNNDLEFLQITTSLIQELMKQRALKEKFERLAPLSISGSMAAQMAHEIRNPCQPISNFVSVTAKLLADTEHYGELLSDPEWIEGAREMADIANKSLKRIDLNVNQLIHLSDIGHIRLTNVSIEEAFNDVSSYRWYLDGGESQIENKPISIIIDVAPFTVPQIRFDKFQLATILSNLIRNAFQAITSSSRDGRGAIHLGVEWIEADKFPLRIYVTDDGPGIPAAVKERLFLPFETTKTQGTGLGCTICKLLIGKIGGEISVNSAMGRGSTFSLHIPNDSIIS